MAIKSSQINATDLDFEEIGDNIKTYLKGQEKFKDYEVHEAYKKAEILISYSDEITECIKLTFPESSEKIFRISALQNSFS